VPLSKCVVISPDKTYSSKRTEIVKAARSAPTLATAQVEVYPMSSTSSDAFKTRFSAAQPTSGFEQGVAYFLHPNGSKYLSGNDYKPVITQEMLAEQIYILRDLGVESFVVNESLYESIKDMTDIELTAAVPEGVPVVGGAAIGASWSANDPTSGTNASDVAASFPGPEYKPHIRDDQRWYWTHGLQHSSTEALVAKVVEEKPSNNEMTVHFSNKAEWLQVRDASAKVSKIIGVAAKLERGKASEFYHVFKIKFFHKDKFENLRGTRMRSAGKCRGHATPWRSWPTCVRRISRTRHATARTCCCAWPTVVRCP